MKVDRWSSDLDEITNSFKQAFGTLSIDELNWKPNASIWSVAQIIHHIIVVNESYYPIMEQIRNNTFYVPRFGQIGFINRFFGKLILNSVQPTQKRKVKTFPIWEPELSAIRSDILKQFEKHQAELKQVVSSSNDLIVKNTVISSPANRMIVYKLETAFDIMVAHEKRHFKQAQEINNIRPTKS
ncbi:MAG: DinB family protein [Cyclobacteriaceae bacterium]|nr:DinB family protein [Cyclobacteriaceae bacterium]